MNRKSEYEMQHFGFSSEQVSQERKYVLEKLLANNLDALTTQLTSLPKTKQLLLEEQQKVQQQIWQSFTELLNALENLDQKYFTIPSHVLLIEDSHLAKQYNEYDEKCIDEELNAAKKNFLENSIMIATLQQENSQYNSLDMHMQQELDFCNDAQQAVQSFNLEPLCELVNITIKLNQSVDVDN